MAIISPKHRKSHIIIINTIHNNVSKDRITTKGSIKKSKGSGSKFPSIHDSTYQHPISYSGVPTQLAPIPVSFYHYNHLSTFNKESNRRRN